MQSQTNHQNSREKCCPLSIPNKKLQEWDRTIPKANYVTLGSIRFGVKSIQRGSSLYSTDEGSKERDVSLDSSNSSKNCDNNCFESTDCCCIGTSNSSSDGQTIYKKETRLPVASSNPVAKNRTLSSSTSTSTTPRASTFKRCLVIENHNQATRSTCCYPNSLKNRTVATELSSKKFHLANPVQPNRTKNCENRTKGASVDDSENGERSNAVRKNYFCENVNRNENSYTSLLLPSPSSSPSSSFQRENSLIHRSSCGVRSINSVIDSDNVIFNQISCNQTDNDQWDQQSDCNLNSRENYSIHLTCNDPDLIQSNQDNVNGVWNVDSVGVSKLRTPSNLCKSNRQVPIIRKLTPKVKTKKNERFECNVIVEQQHKTKIAQLSSVIKQNDNVKSNDGIDDDDDDDNSHFIIRSNPTADVRCLSSTLYNDNLIVCDDHRVNASECIKQSNFSCNGFDEHNSVKKGQNSEAFVKDQYRCQYKKISPQGNRRFANSTGCASLAFLGGNRQYSGIYSNMDKRRNTLERWQKLGFGRRSTNTSTEKQAKEKAAKGSDKTERLRELTELLRGSRTPSNPSAPPPIPPPRKQKSIGSQSQDNSSASSSVRDLTEASAADYAISSKASCSLADRPYQPNKPITIIKSLRPNTSAGQLECYGKSTNLPFDELSKSPPLAEKEDDLFTALPKAESRTIVGSYMQKSIPFRSASFSQVDYSSGKYIRSAIGAFKASLKSNKEPSVIDNTNLTLPRKKDRQSPEKNATDKAYNHAASTSNSPSKVYKSEMSVIFQPNRKLNDAIMDGRLESKFHRESLIEENENEVDESLDGLTIVKASEMVIESPSERGILMATPPQDEFLQTATTCLIPLPVYECTNREDETSEQWINACDEDSTKLFEEVNVESDVINEIGWDVLDKSSEVSEAKTIGEVIKDDSAGNEVSDMKIVSSEADTIPVAVIQSETIEIISNEIEVVTEVDPSNVLDLSQVTEICENAENEIDEQPIIPVTIEHANESTENPETKSEFVEVRKRHNNDDKSTRQSVNLSNSSESVNSVATGEDRRRIDKNKRRKGIYFQWPAVEKDRELDVDVWSHADSSSPILSGTILWDGNIDIPGVASPSKVDLTESHSEHSEKVNETPKKISVDLDTANFFAAAFESTTPDSEISRPAWPKMPRKQNSDERDDVSVISAISDKQYHKISFLRQDSISDNETDRTPPPHDRVSQSQSNDPDLKRYSKRPLRGPYGLMLEAEMKKPAKLLYDEMFNRSESSSKLSDASLQSFDDDTHRKAYRKNNSTHLPIPYHVRASSTPIQSDSHSKEVSHKRFPSYVDTSTVNDLKKDQKKMSLDNLSKSHENFGKDSKKSSGAGDKLQKHSLDEGRLLSSSSSESGNKKKCSSDTSNTIQATPQLLAELLKGSSERLVSEQIQSNQRITSSSLPTAVLKCLDTRTHVVVELFNTEKSYVDSLETVVLKYLKPLKSPENAGIVDVQTVEEIFLMVPTILNVHKHFLDELKRRLDSWNPLQMVGDAFIETFSKSTVLDAYTAFVNNWNRAKDAIRLTSSTRPAFSRFLEAMAREHKGKLSLDNLLIKPVQKFPNYELLLLRLVKHTNVDHPDQKPLQDAIHLVHSILLHLNCKEREALENNQRETLLRDLEGIIEGVSELVVSDRQFICFDLVSIPSGQVGRKERGFFLFSDLLVITSIKRRTGTMRKPNSCPVMLASTLDTNKYKFLTKISIDDLEVVKAKDENVEKARKEIDNLSKDFTKLGQIMDIASSLRCPNHQLEEIVRDLQKEIQRQLSDRQTNDTQLNLLELALKTTNGIQNMIIIFSKPDKRTQWEQVFNEAKQKLVTSLEKYPVPEFISCIPIRKTRAGLQFTCAAPTLGNQKDVWVCNSDGYVGQVCVLSLFPEPTVVSCNGVCNARILCVASIPANIESSTSSSFVSISIEDTTTRQLSSGSNANLKKSDKCSENILDSSSSSDSETDVHEKCIPTMINRSDQIQQSDEQQSTMWLGTEDGCIHVYNCSDNIRIKKNKIKIQHVSAVFSVLYLDNRVFVSLANGDIVVYNREGTGWNTISPTTITVGTVTNPATKLINVHGKLWCSIQGNIKVLNTSTLQVESSIKISTDGKPITNMVASTNHVWVSVLNSANIKCFHSNSFELLHEVNLAPQVNKMLSNCDDIIRQHKAACLRVTSLLACKEMVWVGTSAGVLLTISAIPTAMGIEAPIVTGIPYGHTGHVRFLTCVEYDKMNEEVKSSTNRQSLPVKTKPDSTNLLIISGGDGYEDFRNSGAHPSNEVSGREDSTNHLLLWNV
ncbi:uncharacterized protein LOC119084247 isoform X2 [Bradysia coprophila]|uniref:uncharacterized protein LOC119084247 isoform X2 n=1 Tax=Bradysia coprophila TaxID=38358 RepID=UPI00187D8A6F|nr:uncharacterized protein LOC119084247 isoform X2 [Bradysia coprophila]